MKTLICKCNTLLKIPTRQSLTFRTSCGFYNNQGNHCSCILLEFYYDRGNRLLLLVVRVFCHISLLVMKSFVFFCVTGYYFGILSFIVVFVTAVDCSSNEVYAKITKKTEIGQTRSLLRSMQVQLSPIQHHLWLTMMKEFLMSVYQVQPTINTPLKWEIQLLMLGLMVLGFK